MLHPLALHVPWLKRDKLVFVSFLCEEEKLEWDLKSDVKTGFAEKSHWSSERHPEQLRPPGMELKGLPVISASLQKAATVSPFQVCVLVLALKKDGVKHFAQFFIRLHYHAYCELENWGICACIHWTCWTFWHVLLVWKGSHAGSLS